MRVPPSQSTTSSAARASASSGLRFCRAAVMRVSRVPKQKTSTFARRALRRVRELQQARE